MSSRDPRLGEPHGQPHCPTIELLPTIEFSPKERDSQQGCDKGAGDLTPGVVLRSRYALEEIIGRGGHSLVFRAKDLHRAAHDDADGGRVALKVLLPAYRRNARAVERLTREFRQMQGLSHPGIVRVFDLDCDGDIWFITMELIHARSAAEWLQTSPAISDAMQVIGACAEALQYAHSMGVVHGDLKPSNILVTEDHQIRLIDFGSVPPACDSLSVAVATPSYASPQVLAGMRADSRDDVFSLACVSYEILSEGQRPFGDQSSLEAHRARHCPAAISGMPVDVFAALVRSLAGDREQRASSAESFYRDLLGNAAALTRRVSGGARHRGMGPRHQGTRRALQHVSLASIGVAAACSLVLLLPTARKIVAGDDEDMVATAPAVTGMAPATDASAGRMVSEKRDVTGVDSRAETQSALPSSTIPDSVISDAAATVSRVPGFITFEKPTLIASAAQSMIAIPIRREESIRGSAAVEWQLQGSNTNIDYSAMPPQIVHFSDGEAVRSIFIPLLPTTVPGGIHSLRSFTVSLRQVDGGARLGTVSHINVTIVPQPVVTQPVREDLSNTVAASFTGR